MVDFGFFLFLAIGLPALVIGSLPESEMRLIGAGIYFVTCVFFFKLAGESSFIIWALGVTIVMILIAGFIREAGRGGGSDIGECYEVGRYGEMVCY
ncbi:hypothetical protein N8076_01870 [Gammaproteobacteria bacterium]|nr:hypothetical protein [Gammaproteobacteria bacterium]